MNRVCIAVLLVICSCHLQGCQEPDRPPEAPRAVENVYGFSLTLDLRDATDAEEYYTVDRDGMLGFGGGMEARFERASYTRLLSSDDMQRLNAIIDSERLLAEPLVSSNQPEKVRYEIKIKRGGDSIGKNINGENPRIEALRAALREFANRRLEPELEKQPKASVATQPAAR